MPVEAAALIGRQLDRDLLRDVVDLSEEALDAVLAELTDAVLEPCGPSGSAASSRAAARGRHELAPRAYAAA